MRNSRKTSRCVWLLLAATSCLYACGDDDGNDANTPDATTDGDAKVIAPGGNDHNGPLETTDGDTDVIVPDRYRECSADDDCVLASTSCNGCCERDAVTKALEAQFDRDRTDTCRGYRGPICDCSFAELEARCEKKHCVAVPAPKE